MNIPTSILDNWLNIQMFISAPFYLLVVDTGNTVPSALWTPTQHQICFSASDKIMSEHLASPLMLHEIFAGLQNEISEHSLEMILWKI